MDKRISYPIYPLFLTLKRSSFFFSKEGMRNEGGGGRRMGFLVFGSWKIQNGNEKRGSSSLFSLFLVSLALFYRPRVTRIFRIYSINVCGPRIYTLHEENARNASSVPGITSPPLHHLASVEGRKEGRKNRFLFLSTPEILSLVYTMIE